MSRKNEILTGLFVLGGIALVVGGAFWLSQARLGGGERILTARFSHVGQLQPGNTVTLRGVSVGRVDGISLREDGVEVALRLRSDVVLPPDPVVVLQPASLFGEWRATIVPLSARPDVRPDTLHLPRDRLPGIALADFGELSEHSEEIAENLRSITERFEAAFGESTTRDLARAVQNFSRASEELVALLERQREEFGAFTSDLAEAGDVVRAAATSLDSVITRLAAATEEGELEAIFDDARGATASLKDAAEGFRLTVRDAEAWIARADSAVAEAQTLLASINRGEGSLGRLAQDAVLYENTATALAELRALLDDLKQNPRKYFNLSIF